MDKGKVTNLCAQIQAAANGVYIKGCDDVARSNLAQLMAICNLSAQILSEISKPNKEKEAAVNGGDGKSES